MFSLVYISVPPIPITHFSITTYTVPTYVRTVPPVPLTHFSITTYAYVHIEATYRPGPPNRYYNSLQHMHIYSTAGPNPDTEQQQPQIQKTTLKLHVRPKRTHDPEELLSIRPRGPNLRKVVTSTTGPPGPHWPI